MNKIYKYIGRRDVKASLLVITSGVVLLQAFGVNLNEEQAAAIGVAAGALLGWLYPSPADGGDDESGE